MDSPTVCGALVSPEDNDNIFEEIACGASDGKFKKMPLYYDMRKWANSSRDQGDRATCAAFAAANIKEIHESISKNSRTPPMSPEFIYQHRHNKPIEGMYGRNVFQILKEIGTVSEDLYPYGTTEPPSEVAMRIASNHKIANFTKVTTSHGLKRALLELGPCYMQLQLVDSSKIEFWRGKPENSMAGHAVTVLGFMSDGFIIQNSWGEKWNGDGYAILPYGDWNCVKECWACIDTRAEKRMDTSRMKLKSDELTPPIIIHQSRKTCTIL